MQTLKNFVHGQSVDSKDGRTLDVLTARIESQIAMILAAGRK